MEEEKKAFLWMGFQRKILTWNNRTKDKATVINQIEWRESVGSAEVGKNTARWRERESVSKYSIGKCV